MAFSTSRYEFIGEEVSQLASCTDQAELLYKFKCILHAKSIDLSAVYAPATLGNSTDYNHLYVCLDAAISTCPVVRAYHLAAYTATGIIDE